MLLTLKVASDDRTENNHEENNIAHQCRDNWRELFRRTRDRLVTHGKRVKENALDRNEILSDFPNYRRLSHRRPGTPKADND
jgi:hypothetical protein